MEKKIIGEEADVFVREALEGEWWQRTVAWEKAYRAAWELIIARKTLADERDELDMYEPLEM